MHNVVVPCIMSCISCNVDYRDTSHLESRPCSCEHYLSNRVDWCDPYILYALKGWPRVAARVEKLEELQVVALLVPHHFTKGCMGNPSSRNSIPH